MPKIPPAELLAEIQRTEELRYVHRLHGVLLVANGMSYEVAAKGLGASVRALKYWVARYRKKGLAGLHEGKGTGRKRRLNDTQLREITNAVRQPPTDVGLLARKWTALILSHWIQQRYSVTLGARHCKRVLHSIRLGLFDDEADDSPPPDPAPGE